MKARPLLEPEAMTRPSGSNPVTRGAGTPVTARQSRGARRCRTARPSNAVIDSWKTGVSLVWLARQLPLFGILISLSVLGGAAELVHGFHRRK